MNEFFSDESSEDLPPDMDLESEPRVKDDNAIYTSGIIHYEGIPDAENALPLMADSGLIPEADDIPMIEKVEEIDVIHSIRDRLFYNHADFINERPDGERILKLRIADTYHKADIEVSSNRGLIIDVRYAGEDPENISANYPADLLEYATPRTVSYSDLHKEELQKGRHRDSSIDINESRWAARQFTLHVARYWEREGISPGTIAETPHIQRHDAPQYSSLTITTGIEQDSASKPYVHIVFARNANKDDLQNYAAHPHHATPGIIFLRRYYRMSYSIDSAFGMLQCAIEQGFTDQKFNSHKTYMETRYVTGNDESDLRSFLYNQRLQ
jgi:hypothetical protein